MSQRSLPLIDGHHVGPLFVPRIRRGLVRPKGKEGIIHRAQTVRATPAWADMAHIKRFYRLARVVTGATGELHVVDHIVPKIGLTVCGLHVPCNLRVIHWKENAIKGAATWPGMWGEQLALI